MNGCALGACTLLILAALPALSAAGTDSEASVRLVADGVLRNTTRRLIDRTTGQTFEDSSGLAPRPEISIETKFNAWFYQTWLLADGMRRVAETLDEPAYRDYGRRNLEFILRHNDFFNSQHKAGMKAAPVGDGSHSPIGFFFQITALWHTGLAPLVAEESARSPDARYGPYLARVNAFLDAAPRFEDGSYYRSGKGMMTDDPYMVVPYLVRQWKATGDTRKLDDAVQQVVGTYGRLFDQDKLLCRHLWDLKTRQPRGEFWGRGNGWMLLATVELLAFLPPAHPRRNEVLTIFRRQAEGLGRWQDPDGGWHQVLDHPESWIETSCTGMFVYGLARGVNEGWLDASFAGPAKNGWAALQKKVTPDGDLTDVCGSTDTGDLDFYLNRPRLKGDLHGFGSFLLAGAEILRLEQNSNLPRATLPPSAAPEPTTGLIRTSSPLAPSGGEDYPPAK